MAYASGKHSLARCDRCGFVEKYLDLKQEWNGLRVCHECFEPKHPQLEPKPHTADPQGLQNARPDRVEPKTDPLLTSNPFIITSGNSVINVFEPSHGRSTNDVVVFRNVDGSPGGLAYSLFENSSGFSITFTGTDNYTFDLGSTPTVSGRFGGTLVTAGPVTLTP